MLEDIALSIRAVCEGESGTLNTQQKADFEMSPIRDASRIVNSETGIRLFHPLMPGISADGLRLVL
jgi:hypothetical protein